MSETTQAEAQERAKELASVEARVKRYRKRPIVIEAIQLTESAKENIEILMWAKDGSLMEHDQYPEPGGQIRIRTREGELSAYAGDYIIKGVEGEFYPCGRTIFEKTYLEVDDDAGSRIVDEPG